MVCPKCNASNDSDASFCSECGTPVESVPAATKAKSPRQVYLYALLLLPVIALAAGIGYYKYFLPQGIAAIVNGEEITLSELDAAVLRIQGKGQTTDNKLRYQVLDGLITELLLLQEAYKAGVTISRDEAASAAIEARQSSGLDESAFNQEIALRYGSMQNFERALYRSLLMDKFITGNVVPPNADPRTAGIVFNRWMQDLSARASVRITLAEQWSGAGCSCCGKRAETSARSEAQNGGSLASQKASDAALKYWHEKHGAEEVTANLKDFGCHMQIDIIKDSKIVGSLRYQGGRISEF